MTTWMDNEHWAGAGQLNAEEVSKMKAPNPAEFPETQAQSNSYWIRNYKIDLEDAWTNRVPPESVDVAIIGSGITGSSAAYLLSQRAPELKVAVFESRGLCTGATGRNGGLIGRPEAYDIRGLASTFGIEEAVRQRQFIRHNREMMLAAIEELDAVDRVDLVLKGAMVVFETQEERDAFILDQEFAKQQGLKTDAYVISGEEVVKAINMSPEIAKFGAACLDKCGTIYPRKFVATMLRKALSKMADLSLHPYTPVWKVEQDSEPGSGYLLTTSKGVTRARVVLHATNAYASHLVEALRQPDGVFGCSAHMIGIQPNVTGCNEQLHHGLGYKECFHWMLQRPGGGPFLYGLWKAEKVGRYNDTITFPKDTSIRKEMFSFLETAFPQKFKDLDVEKDVPYDWQGVQGFTMNGASIVGRPDPARKGEFVAVGHNGEGMGRCFACASVVIDALLAELKGDVSRQPPEWFPMAYRRNM